MSIIDRITAMPNRRMRSRSRAKRYDVAHALADHHVKGKYFTARHFAVTRGFIFAEREKTNPRAVHQVTCLAAAQMAIATEAKRFVPEVLKAGGSGVRLLCWAHGG
jgi:hypothetical protein